MRSISGAKNRAILAVAGILMLVAAAWLAAASLDLVTSWPAAEPVLAHPDSTPGLVASHHRDWLLPVAAVVAVLAIALGIAMLIAQIPARPSTAPLRVTDEDGTALATIEPAVLGRALSERIAELPGLLDAQVHPTGTPSALWLQAEVTVADDAEAAWAIEEVRTRLAADVRAAVGADARQVDVLVHLRPRASSARASTTAPRGDDRDLRQATTAAEARERTQPA